MELSRLKRRYLAEGFTEAAIHQVIPDRPRKTAAKPDEAPGETPNTPEGAGAQAGEAPEPPKSTRRAGPTGAGAAVKTDRRLWERAGTGRAKGSSGVWADTTGQPGRSVSVWASINEQKSSIWCLCECSSGRLAIEAPGRRVEFRVRHPPLCARQLTPSASD
jgi:hypothetical protein